MEITTDRRRKDWSTKTPDYLQWFPVWKSGQHSHHNQSIWRGVCLGCWAPYEISNLNRLNAHQQYRRHFSAAEVIWLGFPFYTDAMLGIVKSSIELLAPLIGRADNPPIGFLVNSGFPEALHSRYVKRYLEKLAARLNAPYLGTIVKGGGEGLRMMAEERTVDLFGNLQELGRGFA